MQNFGNPERIHINTEIDDFQMEAKTVFNLGIIINELITNTMKYAFSENKEGKLFLSITPNSTNYRDQPIQRRRQPLQVRKKNLK